MGEIFTAIGRLPEDFRLALVAVDILGLSYQEAATSLGTGEATITSRLYRARQRIAREFTDEPPPTQPPPGNPASGREGNRPDRSLA
jgi:RNA polymerase sigma-70 factor (ECF subfamily)